MGRYVTSAMVCAVLVSFSVYAKEQTPMASLNLKKGYDKGSGLGTGTAQFYDYAPDNRCTGRKRLYKFSLITGAQATKTIPAEQKLILSAYTNRYTSGGGTSTGPGVSVSTASCENRVEFTPMPNETYDVVQKVEIGKRCALEVLTKSNGQPPADLQELDPASCTAKK